LRNSTGAGEAAHRTLEDRYACGPIDVLTRSDDDELRAKLADVLGLYNVEWDAPRRCVRMDVRRTNDLVALGPGRYLTCQRMHVDRDGERLVGTCRAGGSFTYDPIDASWDVAVPDRPGDLWVLTDIESVVSLVLTTGWRELGWVPVHAGTIVRDGICALLCAESGGGKTSLTAAMVRRGWRTLGDDKLLLRVGKTAHPELRALVHTFNLHPKTRTWFPEVGDLERLPTYSEWTDKRKMRPESVWPEATLEAGSPTHLLQLERVSRRGGIVVTALPPDATLSILLHQTVIPSDAALARAILTTIATTARNLKGFRVEIGEDAYEAPECLAELEKWLA
jgi:hypothetical protein